jgi:hypothetical protein
MEFRLLICIITTNFQSNQEKLPFCRLSNFSLFDCEGHLQTLYFLSKSRRSLCSFTFTVFCNLLFYLHIYLKCHSSIILNWCGPQFILSTCFFQIYFSVSPIKILIRWQVFALHK